MVFIEEDCNVHKLFHLGEKKKWLGMMKTITTSKMFDAFVIIRPALIPGDSLQELKLREKQNKKIASLTMDGVYV